MYYKYVEGLSMRQISQPLGVICLCRYRLDRCIPSSARPPIARHASQSIIRLAAVLMVVVGIDQSPGSFSFLEGRHAATLVQFTKGSRFQVYSEVLFSSCI